MFLQPTNFRKESQDLYNLIAPLNEADLRISTRFKDWAIEDIVRHLHVWNVAADLSLSSDEDFLNFYQQIESSGTPTVRDFEKLWVKDATGAELLDMWHKQFEITADNFAKADPKKRLKWAGPDMSARSSITARLMETWSHGQAIYDVLGQDRKDDDRIKDIAHIGISTFGWTYVNRGMQVPTPPPFVQLLAPSSEVWEWHDPSESEFVKGSATEFCQVVTQTRNVKDTDLEIKGDTANQWMSMAQCFAGPPETPPPPGTRRKDG